MLPRRPILVLTAVATAILLVNQIPAIADGRLKLTVVDADSHKTVPCRIHLKDPAGKPVRPPGLPFWFDHFVCGGEARLDLPPGRYTFEIERGPEWEPAAGELEIADGAEVAKNVALRRTADLAKDGWWSGELHVHRPVKDIELLMRAEDLHVAPVITWWNKNNAWTGTELPKDPLVRFDGDRFYHVMGGEDERGGGALLFFNLREPLAIAGAVREFPAASKYLIEAKERGAWIDVEKPFWWDVPLWLASGQVDSIGIANNHMLRDRMYPNEAWGKPRDTKALPDPLGNGLWTQEIYYQALNCGLRVPPSAGSASGVLANPVGYNRMYVHVEGELTHEKWWDNLRAGRVLVTNGPLLRVTVNGELPGHVFAAGAGKTVRVRVELDVQAREKIAAIEMVENGQVSQLDARLDGRGGAAVFEKDLRTSGWFLFRVRCENAKTFRFASSGPYYVQIGDKPHVSRRSARFFLDWVNERMEKLKLDDPQQRREVLDYHNAARKFWEEKVAAATAE
ncbi:MAG: CehA/McbA family metallohydrolase [Planctomycetia bacterium]|nr:CehA/McbA family metallohydrolase [Planctomycetia bacterium]